MKKRSGGNALRQQLGRRMGWRVGPAHLVGAIFAAVSGALALDQFGPPLVFRGAVIVTGGAAAPGALALSGATLRGRLGGRAVG